MLRAYIYSESCALRGPFNRRDKFLTENYLLVRRQADSHDFYVHNIEYERKVRTIKERFAQRVSSSQARIRQPVLFQI
jgi:hypothetical protein